MNKPDNKFIMLPTVDYCFKELMQNPKVRKGFIAALLKVSPESIRETILLPTILERHFKDDKTGKIHTDKMEFHILELQKLPPDVQTGEDILFGMKFFSEQKRLEYEAREKALKDHNSFLKSVEKRMEKNEPKKYLSCIYRVKHRRKLQIFANCL